MSSKADCVEACMIADWDGWGCAALRCREGGGQRGGWCRRGSKSVNGLLQAKSRLSLRRDALWSSLALALATRAPGRPPARPPSSSTLSSLNLFAALVVLLIFILLVFLTSSSSFLLRPFHTRSRAKLPPAPLSSARQLPATSEPFVSARLDSSHDCLIDCGP